MKALAILLTCVGLFSLFSTVTAEVEPIEIKGSHLFYKNGTAFFVSSPKGPRNNTHMLIGSWNTI